MTWDLSTVVYEMSWRVGRILGRLRLLAHCSWPETAPSDLQQEGKRQKRCCEHHTRQLQQQLDSSFARHGVS